MGRCSFAASAQTRQINENTQANLVMATTTLLFFKLRLA